jgi:hypothetical protein
MSEMPEWANDDDDLDKSTDPVDQDPADDDDEVSDEELTEVEQNTSIDPEIEGESGVL